MNNYIGTGGYTIFKNNSNQGEIYKIKNELNVKPYSTHSIKNSSFPIYRESKNKLYLPIYYGIEKYNTPNTNLIPKGIPINVHFKGELYKYQENIVNKYINFVGNSGGGLLDVEPGKGKTVMALKIISRLNVKTIVIVHKSFLMTQWFERINHFLPNAKIGKIQGDTINIDNCDIVLAMLQSLSIKEYDKNTWKSFGLCIYDECHHLSAQVFSRTMTKIICNYNLGLSGTMTRKDGLTKVFKWFLGPVIHKEKSINNTNVNIKCIEYSSSFENVKKDYKGNEMYSSLISNICSSNERTDTIIKIIINELKINSQQQIMILAHNKSIIKYLYDNLLQYEPGLYLGGMKPNDLKQSENKKIITATYAMASEGLDIKTLTTLIMATPKSDVCQSVRRILRTNHINPLVIDIVDNHSIFKKQYSKREKYYKSKKYMINYYLNFNQYYLQNKLCSTHNEPIDHNEPSHHKEPSDHSDHSDNSDHRGHGRLRIISWNIVGLWKQGLVLERAREASALILAESPDVVLLQELVPESWKLMQESLGRLGYSSPLSDAPSEAYFTGALVSKSLRVAGAERRPFACGSRMARDLITFEVSGGPLGDGRSVRVFTAHLESCVDKSPLVGERSQDLRLKQFMQIANEMKGATHALFAGDTNLRAEETAAPKAAKALDLGSTFEACFRPKKCPVVVDAFEASGAPPHAKFTWDCELNDNLGGFDTFKPRARFDRCYVNRGLRPVTGTFQLTGSEKFQADGRNPVFPSDHFGIQCDFEVL